MGHLAQVTRADLGSPSIPFIENRGQNPDEEVKFMYIGDVSAYFTPTGVIYRVFGDSGHACPDPSDSSGAGHPARPFHVFKVNFLGANAVQPQGYDPLPSRSNFFLGNDSSRWVSGATDFGGIVYENIYDSIDLRFSTCSRGLKYSFIVHPGGDPGSIALRYEGASVDSEDVRLSIETSVGELVDDEFRTFQINGGVEVPVSAEMVVENNIVSYRACYDPCQDLIIDPLIFSSFIGGSSYDDGYDVLVDATGNMTIYGYTSSTNFPTTPGAYCTLKPGPAGPPPDEDLFVIKLNSSGDKLLFSTYMGGNSVDYSTAMTVDNSGYYYLVGSTYSSNFPTTPGAYSNSVQGFDDQFVVKMWPNGDAVAYSTLIGGDNNDRAEDVAVNSTSGIVYVCGDTGHMFPTTLGAYCRTHNGMDDATVFMMNNNLSVVLNSTYFGGNGFETAEDLYIAPDGSVIITGETSSPNLPNTTGAYDRTFNGGNDAFIAKFSANLSSLNFSTFVGGNKTEYSKSLAVDSDGRIAIAGHTQSQDFPNTTGAYDTTPNGYQDGFLLEMNSNCSALLFSTFFGGAKNETIQDLDIDPWGNFVVAGYSDSADYPTTIGAFCRTIPNTNYQHCVISRFDPNGTTLSYSTFFGGTSSDNAYAIVASRALGTFYVTGRTYSSNFPTTVGAYDTSHNSQSDVFAFKLFSGIPPSPPLNLTGVAGDECVNLTWEPPPGNPDPPVLEYHVLRGNSSLNLTYLGNVTAGNTTYNDTNVTNGLRYFYGARAVSSAGPSNLSNVINLTAGMVPSQPWNLTAVTGDGFVALNWSAPNFTSKMNLTGYNLYRNTTQNAGFLTALGNQTDYYDGNVSNSVRYYYWVSAVNPIGEGPLSDCISAFPSAKPSEVQGLRGDYDPIGKKVELTWGAPVHDGGSPVTGYRVYRGPDDFSLSFLDTAGSLGYNDSTVVIGNTYCYGVAAVNSYGEGNLSTVPVVVCEKPSVPRDPTAAPSLYSVLLTWRGPASDGGATISYRVHRGSAPDNVAFVQAVDATTYTDRGLQGGLRYCYRISAINIRGESELSVAVYATPYGPPGAVVNFTCTLLNRTAFLSWNPPDNLNGGTTVTYSVYRGSSSMTETVYANTSARSFTDGPLQRGAYYYRVSAVTEYLEGELSIEKAVKVENLAPASGFLAEPDEGPVGSNFTFRSTSSDPDGNIVSWNWEFGDGGTATGEVVSYVFQAAGSVPVTLKVMDNDGSVSSSRRSVIVHPAGWSDRALIAGFTVKPGEGDITTDFVFTSTSYDLAGVISGWEWDFGDGANGSGAATAHKYGLPGVYSVRLTVIDSRALNATCTRTLTVKTLNHPPTISQATPAVDNLNADVGRTVKFTVTAQDEDGDRLHYRWQIDGMMVQNTSEYQFKVREKGEYRIRVTVTDGSLDVSREWVLHARDTVQADTAAAGLLIPLAVVLAAAATVVGFGLFRWRSRKASRHEAPPQKDPPLPSAAPKGDAGPAEAPLATPGPPGQKPPES